MSNLNLSVIISAVDRITQPVRQVIRTTESLTNSVSSQSQELQKLGRLNKDIEHFKKLKTANRETSKTLAETREKASRLGRELANTAKPSAKLRREFAQARKQVQRLEAQQTSQRENLTRLRGTLNQAGVSTRNLGDEQRRLQREAEQATAAIAKQQQSLKNLQSARENISRGMARASKAMVVSTTAITGAFVGLTMANKSFAAQASQAAAVGLDFSTYQSFGKVVSDAGLEAESVIDLVEEMNNKMGESAGIEEMTAVTESLSILGLAYEDIASLSPEKQFLAITKAAQGLGDAQQAASAVDMLMGGESAKIIGHLRQQGTSVDDLVASYKGMSVVTKDGEAGAKAFNKGMSSITFAVGSAFQEISGLIGGALAPALTEWPKKIADFFNNNRDQITQWADKAAAVFPLVIEGIAGLGKGIYQLGSAANSVMQFFGGWENAALVVGAIMAGKFLASVITVASSVATLVTAMGGVGAIMTSIGVGFKALGAAFMSNPIGLVIGAIALAAGLIVANWSSIGSWFSSLWDGIKNTFSSGWDLIRKIFSYSPIRLIIRAWSPMLDWISSKVGWIGDALGSVKNFFGGDDSEQKPAGTAQKVGAAAAVSAALVATPAMATASQPVTNTDNSSYQISIQQQPGEDAEALALKVMDKMRQQKAGQIGGEMFDE